MAKFLFSAAFVFGLFGCASVRAPVTGILYTDAKGGLAATANQTGNREGTSCATSILGLVAFGDASIEAARRNGAVTMISTVDETYSTVFGITKYCTIVRGR